MSAVPSRITVEATADQPSSMPASEYARTVAAVNVGYDLMFTLTTCFLRALRQPTLDLLVVGAGGGMEIAQFLPSHPGWRIVGVDTSTDMLALAQARAERLNVVERVELVHGTVDVLPAERRFDAATCLYVLHFLSDDAKRALLEGIAARLRPEAPVLVASGARVDAADLRDDMLSAWQQHGELMGLPAERMAAIIAQLVGQQADATTEENYVRLLHEAGFQRVTPFVSIMNGGMVGWIAR